jgi:hypothetical protein
MPTPTHSLSHHLLKRSDLEQLGVPTAQVVRWLGKGWLEQIGTLPIDDPNGNAVFAVADPALRAELTQQLQVLGRTEVVVSPTRSRSLLLRCSLLGSPRQSEAAGATAPGHTTRSESDAATEVPLAPMVPRGLLEEVFSDPRVVEALADEAQAIVAEVNQLLTSAREAARLDLLDAASAAVAEPAQPEGAPAPAATEAPTSPDESASPAEGPGQATPDHEPPPDDDEAATEGDEAGDDEGDFFDADDLFEAFGKRQPAVRDAATVANPTPTDTMPPAATVVTSTLPPADAMPNAADTTIVTAAADVIEPATAPEPSSSWLDAPTQAPNSPDPRPTEAELDELLAPSSAVTPSTEFGEKPLPFHDGIDATAADAPTGPATAPAAAVAVAEPTRGTPTQVDPTPLAMPGDTLLPHGTAAATLDTVAAFLGELRQTLVELAQRSSAAPPSPPSETPPLDVTPLVAVMQEGLAQTREHTASQAKALHNLEARLGQLGERIEHGVALAVHAAIAHQPHGTAHPQPTAPTATPGSRKTLAMLAMCVLLVAWSAVLWFKTGNARLALGTLVGANAIGCAMLLGRRR